ncbi:MAG TPA: fimbrillin family protein [Candidatus Avibacteroides excrementipullorum]|nr:fimbrillin family protein [Candidatus Avibacteroides excrementipullorum]
MKKIVYYSLCAVALAALSSCQEDIVEEAVIPAQTGDEITFGSELDEQLTKTFYGPLSEDSTYYPVEWEDGDHISIYCPEAAQTKIVKYKITPNPSNPSTSSAVTKVNPDEAGLQWGDAPTHHFSAFYPGDRILGSEGGLLKAEIPVRQEPVRWEKKGGNETGGITYTGVANTDYAFMWAYNTHNKSDGGDVALTFKPWVTILDVEINGPANAGESIKMSSVQLRSLSGETLNGEFLIDFNPVEDNESNYPIYKESGNPNATRSQISIQLYDDEWPKQDGTKGDFITLNHGDKIVVRFYLLPKDVNYDTNGEGRNDLQIRVTPFNSAVLTRTLNAQEGTVHGGILAHKVNKVILPPVSNEGANYWMSSLDPNIYVTELSLPGSKMSYQTADNVSGRNAVYYQDLSIAQQVTNGIRAFQIQTASTNTAWGSGDASDQVLYMTVAGNKTTTRFKEIVKEIATGLKTAEAAGKNQEYAFILLTASLSQCEGYGLWPNRTAGNLAWMDAIRNDLAEMAAAPDTYRLYTGEITPTTTINDVKGHIIIKVNYNDDDMGNHLSETDRIPAMFAKWGVFDDVSTPFTETEAYAINSMRWGTSHNVNNGALQWFYHEATSVGYNNNGGEETYAQKIGNIEDMWNRSIDYYKNNSDNSMWFLNDLGGCYVNGIYSSGESQDGVSAWTQEVGPYATGLLQNRTKDATLGIVLINYANPDNPYSGNLIQTIINNNFNFQLRTDDSAQAENYDAQFVNGGNAIGWD